MIEARKEKDGKEERVERDKDPLPLPLFGNPGYTTDAVFCLILNSFSGGKLVRSGDYDALIELATICSLCNDSSVDFNEVRVCVLLPVLRLFQPLVVLYLAFSLCLDDSVQLIT